MRKCITLLLCLVFIFVLSGHTLALDLGPGSIVDDAQLLTVEQESTLRNMAAKIYEESNIFVVIVTTNSLNGKSAQAFADDFYDQNYYNTNPDGVLLLINMDSREWHISTCGKGIRYLSDNDLDHLSVAMLGYLRENRFYDAFTAYLNALPSYLENLGSDASVSGEFIRIVLVSLLIGASVGGIVILVMRGQMNTARAQTNAQNYLVNGTYQLKKHADIFLYSRVTRIRIPQNNGSSTHRSSGGVRHGGRGGKF